MIVIWQSSGASVYVSRFVACVPLRIPLLEKPTHPAIKISEAPWLRGMIVHLSLPMVYHC
jgi:hypothetical protein